METREHIGGFIRWGQAVTVDQVRKIMRFLPESRDDELVEIDCADDPSDEELDIRISSF